MEVEVCRRCLLQDMADNDYYQSVLRYRSTMPAKQRADDEEYARRLDHCRACQELENGVCRQCGCFVEMRAAALKMHCPLREAPW